MEITKEIQKEILKRIGKCSINEQELEKYLNDIESNDPLAFVRKRVVRTYTRKFGGDIDDMIALLHALRDCGCRTVKVYDGNACVGYINAYKEETETDDEYYNRLADLVWERIYDAEEQHKIEKELLELHKKEKELEDRLKRYRQ